MRPCPACGEFISNAAKRCRHCGHGEAVVRGYRYLARWSPGHPLAMSDGYVLEHRWLMHEMAIPVGEHDHVHHKNGDTKDNRWSNLEVMPEAEHHRHHIAEAGCVTNQYGTWPLKRLTEEKPH